MDSSSPGERRGRIALFGGTFDPPHLGHIAVATAAADCFQLDTVLFAPVGNQPLKPEGSTAPFAHRLAMVQLCCRTDGRFAASEIDAPRADGRPNFAIDALLELRASLPAVTLFQVVGADSFHQLARWRDPRGLLAACEWIVVSRPGVPLADPAEFTLTAEERAHVHLLDQVHLDIAATGLRRRLQQGESTDGLLLPTVADYILEHGLYR